MKYDSIIDAADSDEYKIECMLEEGNYARVLIARDSHGRQTALKTARSDDPLCRSLIAREFELLRNIRHSNVVRVNEYGISREGLPYFTLELASGVSVTDAFKGFSEELCYCFLQVLDGLCTIHAKGYVHCDLKPEHIIWDHRTKQAKIIDFGFAHSIESVTENAGTLSYMAPEVLKGCGCEPASDLYSLGLILDQVLSGRIQSHDKIDVGQVATPPEVLLDLVRRMLAESPGFRPSAQHVYRILGQLASVETNPLTFDTKEMPTTAYLARSEIEPDSQSGAVLMYLGEPGMGKTRLMREARYQLLRAGWKVLFHSAGLSRSLMSALSSFLAGDQTASRETTQVPEVFEGLMASLRDKAHSGRIGIVVDDADKLSPLDRAFLQYLMHGTDDLGIRVLVAAEPTEAIKNMRFETRLLRPFSSDELERLVSSTFGGSQTKGRSILVQWLMERSGGRPQRVVDSLKALVRAGILCSSEQGWVVQDERILDFTPPESDSHTAAATLEALSDCARQVVRNISAAERPLDVDLLRMVVGQGCEVAIQELKAVGVAQEYTSADSRRFVWLPSGLCSHVKSTMGKDGQMAIVRHLVELLRRSYVDALHWNALLSDLYSLDGQPSDLCQFSELAGDQCVHILDYQRAVKYFERARDAAGQPGRKSEIELKIGRLHRFMGDNKSALAHFGAAVEAICPEKKAILSLETAKAHLALAEYAKATDIIEQALQAEENLTDIERCQLLNCLGFALTRLGRFDAAGRILEQALDLAMKTASAGDQADAMYYRLVLQSQAGLTGQAVASAQSALGFCTKQGLEKQAGYCAYLLAALYLESGNLSDCLNVLENAVSCFVKTRQVMALSQTRYTKALVMRRQGRQADAERLLVETLNDARKMSDKEFELTALLALSNCGEDAGDFTRALKLNEEVLVLDERNPDAKANIVRLSSLLGHFEHASAMSKEIAGLTSDPVVYISLSEFCIATDRPAEARSHVDQAISLVHAMSRDYLRAPYINLSIARLGWELGDVQGSALHAERALAASFAGSAEHVLAGVLASVCKHALGTAETLDIDKELSALEKMGVPYWYCVAQRYALECILRRKDAGIVCDPIFAAIAKIEPLLKIMNARGELKRLDAVKLGLCDALLRDRMWRRASRDYLDIFSGLGDIVGTKLGEVGFAEAILEHIMQATGAERGAIFAISASGNDLVVARSLDGESVTDAGLFSRSAVELTKTHDAVFIDDAQHNPELNVRKSILLNNIRAMLCVPLLIENEVVGAIYLDSRRRGWEFSAADRDFLKTTGKLAGALIQKADLFQRTLEANVWFRSSGIGGRAEDYFFCPSRKMQEVHRLARRVAVTSTPVLICGETGTGKGMLAKYVHAMSDRKDRRFVSISCGAIPDTLLESELFGHAKGAFTGASSDKRGLLEDAEGGTVFLDDISNASPGLQAKILQAVEEKLVRRVGDTRTRTVDVRFLFATNKNLEDEVARGGLRKDLFYRINALTIQIGPLRDRSEDVAPLAHYFLSKYAAGLGKKIYGFAVGALEKLSQYRWPGNIRELRNVIERAAILCRNERILARDIMLKTAGVRKPSLREVKKEAIVGALRETGWNVTKSAEMLQITRKSVYRSIKKYGITKSILTR